MADYTVHVGRLHEGYRSPAEAFAFERWLFNEPAHLHRQPCPEAYIFSLVSPRPTVEARVALFVHDRTGWSPFRAPFGSVEFNPRLGTQPLDLLLTRVEAFARDQGLQRLQLKGYPFCYAPEAAAVLSQRLLVRGFVVVGSELNYHLPVTTAAFTSGLPAAKKRYLQKCEQRGLVFREAAHPNLESIYAFVTASRVRRGFPVSLPWEDFQALFTHFPDAFRVFTVQDGEQIAALSVAVRLNSRVLYSFYAADDPDYRLVSPTVRVMQGLYAYCQQHGFALLDLGIATEGGVPNTGLIRFKRELGAQTSLKLTFEKRLS